MAIRVGAVSYLNARPLVQGLEQWPERFHVRYDEPSRCATLLHEGAIDLGLIPSIEYLGGDYRIVPEVAVASDGPVASVALFTRVPVARVRSIALDTSSRTSVALIRVLCAHHFRIQPDFVSETPDLARMLSRHDAALLIGDRALFADPHRFGVDKIDLGSEWQALTGLPFVYAFWAGAPGAVGWEDVRRLQAARDAGERCVDDVARAFFPGDPPKQDAGARYLRENIHFRFGAREQEGYERFLHLAHASDAAPPLRRLLFYSPSSLDP